MKLKEYMVRTRRASRNDSMFQSACTRITTLPLWLSVKLSARLEPTSSAFTRHCGPPKNVLIRYLESNSMLKDFVCLFQRTSL